MSIAVKNTSKHYVSNFRVINDISLEVKTGQLVALLGPSGSGKTTLLRIIAGLEAADSGQVFFGEKDVTDSTAYERRAGFVFQQYALFQHMTIFENIAFGLHIRRRRDRPSKEEIKNRVNELLRLIQLDDLGKRFPAQLSGGQRQRVALARALAIEPAVLLLDEPFGALDAKVRKDLRRWLRDFHDKTHLTSLFVTHDQDEAFEVADEVVILNGGIIQQRGTPKQIKEEPANDFVRDFIGLPPAV